MATLLEISGITIDLSQVWERSGEKLAETERFSTATQNSERGAWGRMAMNGARALITTDSRL
jgi:hypothetical protein